MRLRPANPADLDLLRRWQDQPRVLVATDDDWGRERELHRNPDWREQLIAEVEGRPVGFVKIIDPAREETRYWGECPAGLRAIDIWIGEESDLGKGFGTRMMKQTIERCFAEPEVEAIVIDPLESNTRARRLYERLGFRFIEHRRFGEDDCAVYRLDRSAWNGAPPGVDSMEVPWRSAERSRMHWKFRIGLLLVGLGSVSCGARAVPPPDDPPPGTRAMWLWLFALIGAFLGAALGLFGPVLLFRLLSIGSGSYEDVLFIWFGAVPGGFVLGAWSGYSLGGRFQRRRQDLH